MPRVALAPFYPIIDLGVTAREEERARELVAEVLAAGAPWLQLRSKRAPAARFLEMAREVVARAAAAAARVIVNDRLDVALLSGAAGVHVGQTDLPVGEVRRLVGDELVIGVSTHSLAEARRAEADGADYVGFGPLFATGSKSDALEQRPPGTLAAVRAGIILPIVAIGGITEATAAAVLSSGATAVAMIGALASSPDPRSFTERLLRQRA
jgi:thiamine-phosphate pyrophosphorylase